MRASSFPRIILLLALALPLLTARAGAAQEAPTKWQPLGGPGGRLTQLAAAPNGRDLYAVSAVTVKRGNDQTQWRDTGIATASNALYASRDAGATWQPLTNDLPPGEITALYVDHQERVWVGLQMREDLPGRRNGLWQSADHGATWWQVTLDRNDLIIMSIIEDAAGQLLFGAVDAGGVEQGLVYRTTDDAATWTPTRLAVSDLSAGIRLTRLIPHPTDEQVLFGVATNGNVLRSADGGASWQVQFPIDISKSGSALLVITSTRPNTVFLAQAVDGAIIVRRSTDAGKNWSDIRTTGLSDGALQIYSMLALPRNILLIGTEAGAYRSADDGVRWQPLEGVLSSGVAYSFASTSSNRVLAATEYGLFESTDAGAVWRASGSGLPANSAIRALLTHADRPDLLVAAPTALNDVNPLKLLLARDGGRTWLPADVPGFWGPATAWAIDPTNPDNLYVAGADYVATSKDGGFSWRVRYLPFALDNRSIAVAPSDGSTLYMVGPLCMRSNDGGQTWTDLPSHPEAGCYESTAALAVDPANSTHLWSGSKVGVHESRDGGQTWQSYGLDGQSVRWLAISGDGKEQGPLTLYAGLAEGGLMRRRAGQDWQALTAGLPSNSVTIAFLPDPRAPGWLWAARDGGGVYRSTDGGDTWANVGQGMGDNLALALAINYQEPGSIFAGTATAGIWTLGASGPAPAATETPASGSPTRTPTDASGRAGVDARIEVVWPHDFAAIEQARLANIGIRLFVPGSLQLPSCGWRPKVQLWRAVNNEPAQPIETAEQRTVDGQPFPYWDANDIDVSATQDRAGKIYFLVTVDGVDTATSVWAHAADARTYYPEQEVPSGIATGAVDAVDARIQIVWPHDRQGAEAGVDAADLANVAVTLFKHGTRLSVPPSWSGQVLLYGAWNSEVARVVSAAPVVSSRQAGVITYPVWEFNDAPVDRARDGANRLYLWAVARGVTSYPTIWAHGADSRTYFPAVDEPVQGCLP